MQKFFLLYYAPAAAMASMATATDEEKQAGMAQWMAWKEKNDSSILDFGSPLMPGQVIGSEGIYAPAMNEITGYSLVQAESEEALQEMLKDHPHLAWWEGCKVEYKACIQMG